MINAFKRYPKIGELRHRITFQELVTSASDGIGGRVSDWQDIATTPTVWAKIDPVAGLERFFQERLEQNITHKITIRYRDDLQTSMRITHEGRVFEIRNIRKMLERNDFVIIEAMEGPRS